MERERIGRLGVWTFLDLLPGDEAVALCRDLEAWGYAQALAPGRGGS